MSVEVRSPVVVENPGGAGPFVIVCDHASNRIPDEYQSFGFDDDALATHIAWDAGALAVSRRLSAVLDAPLLWPDVSRLVIDCNRPVDASSLIVVESEGRPVPANRNLSEAQRAERIQRVHAPYHDAINACLKRRHAPALIAIHSFTPVYLGKARPWQVGIVFDHDARLADALMQPTPRLPSASTSLIPRPTRFITRSAAMQGRLACWRQ